MRYFFYTCRILLFLSLILSLSCDSAGKREVSFSYRSIMYQEFRSSEGKVIPITVEQSIETDGDISRDGEYFFYSSNRDNGNFDIYIREMENVAVSRLTSHPSRDTSPVISPDGKYLAFVSNREDPEGDIYILKIDAAEIIEAARKEEALSSGIDQKARNITQYQDPSTGTIMILRDSNPAWSPDGKQIVFSSKRGGSENLFIMDPDGKNIRQLTRKGGVYPRFSRDGRKIIFVSYRNGQNQGEIYIKNLASGREKPLTSSSAIKLYPEFLGSDSAITYTSIEKDTNSNGKIDLKDRSVLRYLNMRTKQTWLLTRHSRTSFKGIWVPGFKTRLYNGALLYSDQIGENINLNLIPDKGIIPLKRNAATQLDHALRYATEFSDYEKYVMALKRVYYFFGKKKDQRSKIFSARALKKLFLEYLDAGMPEDAGGVLKHLEELNRKNSFYVSTQLQYCRERLKNRRGTVILINARKASATDKAKSSLLPFLTEDIADGYAATGERGKALEEYQKLLKNFPRYLRKSQVHLKYALLYEDRIRTRFSDSTEYIYQKGLSSQKMTISKHLIQMFRRDASPRPRKRKLIKLRIHYAKNKKISTVIDYGIAVAEMQVRAYRQAERNGKKALATVRKTDVMFFYLNSLLGEVARRQGNFAQCESHLYQATLRYLLIWKEEKVRDHIKWLINYYEDYGERALLENKTAEAEKLFKRYSTLMTYLHRKKRFENFYNQYGARSHVLYIDTYNRRHGAKAATRLISIYEKALSKARMDFDKAHIYALGYLHSLHALAELQDDSVLDKRTRLKNFLEGLKKSLSQINWASFIDDTFIDPYVLKSWLYQYVDLLRENSSDSEKRLIAKYMPLYLYEKNLPILQRALEANDEKASPVHEAKIHLNMGNNCFLLVNYPEALTHFKKAQKLGLTFSSMIEEAVFHFHLGYSFWQTGDISAGRKEMQKALYIYQSLGAGKGSKAYRHQLLTLYSYFALFTRMEEKNREAITWYQRILSFSENQKIKIDRARYLQEIAQCYCNLGDDTKAIHFINKANRLLKKYNNKEKTYKIKFQLFGIIPFYLIDLGEGAIIGETKIFNQLNTFNKKMLSLAMLEKIHADRGNYAKAVEFLKQKVKYLEKRESETDRTSLITALNNLGYYSFRQNRPQEAEQYFRRAWQIASNPDNLNLEATFTAIMNLTNLYASLLEGKSSHLKDPLATIDRLIVKITEFRNRYEENRYKEEEKKLQKLAKTQKREVTKAERADLRRSITEEANTIYFKIDIALGVLTYYKAELQVASLAKGTTSWQIYSDQKKIFQAYHQALVRFQNALSTIEEGTQTELAIKLLLNQGACYTRIQSIDRAYGSFLDAKTLAEKYRLQNILFNVYTTMGTFLMDHGETVEGADSAAVAMEYLQKATAIVESNPYPLSGNRENIYRLYNNISLLSLKRGNNDRACFYQRQLNLLRRNFIVFQASPDFSDTSDAAAYQDYIKVAFKKNRQEKNLSSLLLKGLPEDDMAVKKVLAENKKLRDELSARASRIRRNNPAIFRYISMEPEERKIPENAAVLLFKKEASSLHMWHATSKRLRLKRLPLDKGTLSQENINTLLKKFTGKKRLYAIANSDFFNLYSQGLLAKVPLLLITDYSDITFAARRKRHDLTTVYHTGKGLKAVFTEEKYTLHEEGEPLFPLHAYSIIIDGRDSEKFRGRDIFSRSFSPLLFIKGVEKLNLEKILLTLEGARYAGAESVTFTTGTDPAFLKKLVATAGTSNISPLLADQPEGTFTLAGVRSLETPDETPPEKTTGKTHESWEKFSGALKNGRLEKAAIILEAWKSSLPSPSQKQLTDYYTGHALILLLKNSGKQGISLLNEAKKLQGKIDTATLDFSIALLEGEEGSFERMKTLVMSQKIPAEYVGLARYITAVSEGEKPEKIPALTAPGDSSSSSLLSGRLLYLAARTLALSGFRQEAGEILQGKNEDIITTKTERFILRYLAENRETKKLKDAEDLSLLSFIKKRQDTRIAGQVIQKLKAGLSRAGDKGHWSMHALFTMAAAEYLLHYGEYSSAGEYLKKCNALLPRRYPSFDAYLAHLTGVSAMALEKYQEAYSMAQKAEKILTPDHSAYEKNQLVLLHCEAHATDMAAAKTRLQKLQQNRAISPKGHFTLTLLDAYITLKEIALQKKAAPAAGRLFEKKYYTALTLADRYRLADFTKPEISLFKKVAESHIDYKISTGKKTDALISAEMKRHMLTRMKLPPAQKSSFPAGFRQKKMSAGEMSAAITADPSLLLRANIPFLFTGAIQKKLPEKSMLTRFIRNKNDIYCWVIMPRTKRIIRLAEAYPRLKKITASYTDAVRGLDSTFPVSVELEKIFSPLLRYFKKTSRIYIVTDEYLENVPFEIAGSKRLLEETHSLVYVTSLTAALKKLPRRFTGYAVSGPAEEDLVTRLEKTAMSETGISFQKKPAGGNFHHDFSSFAYDPYRKIITTGTRPLLDVSINAGGIYFPRLTLTGIGAHELALKGAAKGISYVIVNNNSIHDINNALFIERFYTLLRKGEEPLSAFYRAKSYLKRNRKLKHPAYWQGLRIYCNGL